MEGQEVVHVLRKWQSHRHKGKPKHKEVYAKCQISKTERRSLKRKERLVHSLVTRQLLGRDFEKTFLVTDSPGGNRLLWEGPLPVSQKPHQPQPLHGPRALWHQWGQHYLCPPLQVMLQFPYPKCTCPREIWEVVKSPGTSDTLP